MDRSTIEARYRARTPRSARLMEQACQVMPGGGTRGVAWHRPYPIVIERGSGSRLWDVDGNEYVDVFYNGLSLIHGHAYPPIVEAVRNVLARGSGWPVASPEQIELAELVCDRLASVEHVRFTSSGTEAGMLAVKIARLATGRPAILKAWAGYHGSYDDLEVGLYGQGPIPGRAWLAEFGNVESFERVLEEHGSEIAAVVLEPMMFTGVVTPPPPGFLKQAQEAARNAGALFVLDDCLMLRLAHGGSAEKYGLDPDLTFLGKFFGGGTPMGAVGGRVEVMKVTDPREESHIYHGGSFNGNIVGCVAAKIGLDELSAQRIDEMDRRAATLRKALEEHAVSLGVPFSAPGTGSALGIYLASPPPRPTDPVDLETGALLSMAAQNHGVYMGPGCELAMATVLDDDDLSLVIEGLSQALEDVAGQLAARPEAAPVPA